MGGRGGGRGGRGGYNWQQHVKNRGGGGGRGGRGQSGWEGRDGRDSYGGSEEPFAKQPRISRPSTQLGQYVWDLEGNQYGAYRQIKGEWREDDHTVFVDHVQGDAYAPPSHFRLRLPAGQGPAAQHVHTWSSDPVKNRAVCDFVLRVLSDLLRGGSGADWTKAAPKSSGWSSSKGGDIQVAFPSQFVLRRSAIVVTESYFEARMTLSLPARGRTIEGHKCAAGVQVMVEQGKRAFAACFSDPNQSSVSQQLAKHINCVED